MSISMQVLLLAGTRGSRMPPLATPSPKCMLPIANRPMLFYSLFSIARAVDYVLVVTSAQHADAVREYCQNVFPEDPLVRALRRPALTVDVLETDPDAGTAELLAQLNLQPADVLVMSADYVGDIDLAALADRHREKGVAATVAFVEKETNTDTDSAAKGKKGGKKKPKGAVEGFDVEGYALLNQADNRLLAVFSKADLEAGSLRAAAPLVNRYPSISVRSNLSDPHIYILNFSLVQQLLFKYSKISSLKYDLIPYLARRQHTLSDEVADWELGLRDVSVVADVITGVYAKRANTVDSFKRANLAIAGGLLDAFLNPNKEQADKDVPAKKNKEKKSEKVSVFETEGERCNVSTDSAVGPGVSAGDRVSIKKSVIGAGCQIASNVKVNGCVVLDNVTLEEGANLAGCVVCEGASIGGGATLKNCNVASHFVLEGGTEGTDRDFTTAHQHEEDTSIAQAFEFI
ncbi:Translation initiation factor eIF2B, subunit gamma [Chondrus crispus]|uniref:Translation initiation factor eIF2B subunit gamma n=1 Tax=Chondrus crispus TaxID=2769 RepID=R7QHB3_CHOCR|nr:Translation initiation factor eIF2B, subunit gamma [Chondrus crispus]CDF36815.1 Translation initiation factor eIF2B, subunit gamma [Chondrus crispus]|eukprot:XP_005716634.1 Translation initiation factor eIF2B, subunit gamma [Chondrus crispus]